MRTRIALGTLLALLALGCSDSTTAPNDPVMAALLTPGRHAFSGGDSTCSVLGDLIVESDSAMWLTTIALTVAL